MSKQYPYYTKDNCHFNKIISDNEMIQLHLGTSFTGNAINHFGYVIGQEKVIESTESEFMAKHIPNSSRISESSK